MVFRVLLILVKLNMRTPPSLPLPFCFYWYSLLFYALWFVGYILCLCCWCLVKLEILSYWCLIICLKFFRIFYILTLVMIVFLYLNDSHLTGKSESWDLCVICSSWDMAIVLVTWFWSKINSVLSWLFTKCNGVVSAKWRLSWSRRILVSQLVEANYSSCAAIIMCFVASCGK